MNAEVEQLAPVYPGECVTEVCPFCKAKHERSFNVWRNMDGTVGFKCWRASCEAKGRIGCVTRVTDAKGQPKKQLREWHGPIEPLADVWKEYLNEKVGFTDWHIENGSVGYAPREDRVVYPIFRPRGGVRGYTLRTYYDGIEPKALTFINEHGPRLSHYRTGRHDFETWIVEDIPSAIRLSRYAPTVALNGTGVNMGDIEELNSLYDRVVWALDADAFNLSLRWKRKYGMYFRTCRAARLPKDLKDMKEDELEEFYLSS